MEHKKNTTKIISSIGLKFLMNINIAIIFTLLLFFSLIPERISANENLKYRIAEKNDNFIVIAISKKEDNILFNRRYYRVKGGETLEDISENYRIPIEEIIKINDLRNRRDLQPDQILFLDKNPSDTKKLGGESN